MSQLTLTDDQIARVAAEPTLYDELAFLQPLKAPALRLATQLQKAGCRGCAKRALRPTVQALGAAFTQLVVAEQTRTPNQLPALRARIVRILGGSFDQVLIKYTDKSGTKAEIAF